MYVMHFEVGRLSASDPKVRYNKAFILPYILCYLIISSRMMYTSIRITYDVGLHLYILYDYIPSRAFQNVSSYVCKKTLFNNCYMYLLRGSGAAEIYVILLVPVKGHFLTCNFFLKVLCRLSVFFW
jgi:hypothetical protein